MRLKKTKLFLFLTIFFLLVFVIEVFSFSGGGGGGRRFFCRGNMIAPDCCETSSLLLCPNGSLGVCYSYSGSGCGGLAGSCSVKSVCDFGGNTNNDSCNYDSDCPGSCSTTTSCSNSTTLKKVTTCPTCKYMSFCGEQTNTVTINCGSGQQTTQKNYRCKNETTVEWDEKIITKGCFTYNANRNAVCGKTTTVTKQKNCPAGKVCNNGNCITANQPPTADFTPNPSQGSAPLTVNFTNNSFDPDNDPLTYSWDFGNNNFSSEFQPSNVYRKPSKTFNVTLTVYDNRGGTGQITKSVTTAENKPPIAKASASPEFVNPGDQVIFSSKKSEDPEGLPLTFKWDFGDNTGTVETTEEQVTHTYSESGGKTFVLTVKDSEGLTSQDTGIVWINTPPTAKIDITPKINGKPAGKPGTEFVFDASNSFDEDIENGQPDSISFEWDFGDNTEKDTKKVTNHIYPKKGVYTVTLTVTDSLGLKGIATQQVKTNTPPIADFMPVPRAGVAPLTVDFKNFSSDMDNEKLTYVWDFGGGNKGQESTEKEPQGIVFNIPGQYNVTLTVTDESGASDSKTKTVDTGFIKAIKNLYAENILVEKGSAGKVNIFFQCEGMDPSDKILFEIKMFKGESIGTIIENCSKTSTVFEGLTEPGLYEVIANLQPGDPKKKCANCPKKTDFVVAQQYEGSTVPDQNISSVLALLFALSILFLKK